MKFGDENKSLSYITDIYVQSATQKFVIKFHIGGFFIVKWIKIPTHLTICSAAFCKRRGFQRGLNALTKYFVIGHYLITQRVLTNCIFIDNSF